MGLSSCDWIVYHVKKHRERRVQGRNIAHKDAIKFADKKMPGFDVLEALWKDTQATGSYCIINRSLLHFLDSRVFLWMIIVNSEIRRSEEVILFIIIVIFFSRKIHRKTRESRK